MLYKTNEQDYELDTIIFDLNGTLAVWWMVDERIPGLLGKLKEMWFRCILLTWDQRWVAAELVQYGLEVVIAWNASQKKSWVQDHVDGNTSVAIGNARIDIGMFEITKIRIATLQWEWIHTGILSHVDIIVPSVVDAILLFIDHDRFAATMKI